MRRRMALVLICLALALTYTPQGQSTTQRNDHWRKHIATADAHLCVRDPVSAVAASSAASSAPVRSASEWNRIGLESTTGATTDFALSALHFGRAYAQAQKDVRALQRSMRAAQRDLQEVQDDMEADADQQQQPQPDPEDVADVAMLEARIQELESSIATRKHAAAEYLNNEAVSFMRQSKMNESVQTPHSSR